MLANLLERPHGPTMVYVIADFAFVMMDAMAQNLETKGIAIAQVVLVRFLISAIACAGWVYHTIPDQLATIFDLRDPIIRLMWIRGVMHTLELSSFYLSLKYLPLSDVTALFQLKPVPTAITCWIFLKEMITRVQSIAMLISLGGVVLVAQPVSIFGSAAHVPMASPRDTIVALVATAFGTIEQGVDLIILKKIGMVDSYLLLLVYCISACILSTLYIVIIQAPSTWALSSVDWAMLFSLTAFGFIAQICTTSAVQREKGIKIAILGYFQIVFAAMMQIIFTFTPPSPLTVVGSIIIIAAGIWSIVKGAPQNEDAKALEHAYELVGREEEESGTRGRV